MNKSSTRSIRVGIDVKVQKNKKGIGGLGVRNLASQIYPQELQDFLVGIM